MLVPANLEIALRYLRQAQKGYHQVFWIGAISTNQQDLSECKHEVSMRSLIFKNARKVMAWLGPANETSDIAMKFLEKFETIPDTPESVKKGLLSMSEVTWAAIQNLLRRSWFYQLWIIRQVTLAKEVDVFCGNRTISWSIFERIEAAYTEYGPEIQQYTFKLHVRRLASWERRTETFPERSFTRTILGSDGLTTFVAIRRRWKEGRPYSMLEALAMIHSWGALDICEKLHSLLPLVDDDIQRKIVVDYTSPTWQVYSRFACYWLEYSRDLDLLSYSNKIRPNQGSRWVPNWGRYTRTSSLDPGYGSRPFANQSQRLYNATLGSSTSLEFVFDGKFELLRLSGIRIGYLEHLGCSLSRSTSPIIDQLIEWKRLMDAPRVIERSKQELRNDVFIRTILADQDFDMFAGSKRLKPRMKEIQDDEIHQALQGYSWALQYSLEDRTFMVTDKGYVGLCPEHAEVGDEVFLLYGGRMPYILRSQDPAGQQSGKYELIGEA